MSRPARLGRERLASVAIAIAIALVGAWAFTDLEVRQEITAFGPSGQHGAARIAREVTGSELSRTIVIAIGADDEADAIAGARALTERLREVEGVAWVRSGPPPGIDRVLYDLYFPRRYAFFADSESAARARLIDADLAASAERLRTEITSEAGPLVRRVAPEDPLLAFRDHLLRLRGSSEGGPRIVDGQLVSADGWALVLLASRASPFSSADSAPILSAIDREFRAVNRVFNGHLRLEQSGVHRFALRAEEGIRADVQRISTLSTIGIIALFLVLYRRPRFLLLGAVPLAAGTVVAAAACRLVFGGVHGITLAFGSTLLGVGIDYIAHYVNHDVLEPDPAGPSATMKRLWPGLALAAGTTIAGLAALGWAPFSAMREMALFAAVGVGVSLVATRILVPPWMPRSARPPPRLASLAARGCDRIFRTLVTRRAPWLVLPIAALVIASIGLPRLRWIDDIRALNQAEPELLAEDTRVRNRLAQGDSGRLVLAFGEDDEQALARNGAAHAVLEEARAGGQLETFRSIHPMLRAAALQERVERAVIESPRLAERTMAALDAAGLVGETFGPFRASLVRHEPLRWEDLRESAAIDLVRPFRVELDGRIAYVSFVQGVRDAGALRDRLEAIDGVEYFDQGEFLTDAYRTLRTSTIELVLAGLLVVLVMCVARYRSAKLGLASVLPAMLAAASALGLLGIAGQPANLMHLVGALLVLSMGEDYAVFLIESRDDPRHAATTMVGIGVACLTTVLSFGLLAMSSHPAMRALGLMVSIGLGLSLLLAPLSLLVAARPRS